MKLRRNGRRLAVRRKSPAGRLLRRPSGCYHSSAGRDGSSGMGILRWRWDDGMSNSRGNCGCWRARLPRSPGHVFYQKLNELLAEAGFDRWVEARCRPSYAEKMGRPGIPPGVYFRMLLVGYFEGIVFAARHRVAVRRFAVAAEVSGAGVERRVARPFVAVGDSRAVAAGSACGRVRVGADAWPARSRCSTARRWAWIAPRWRPTRR